METLKTKEDEDLLYKMHTCGIPSRMQDGLLIYLRHRVEPGSFLLAVLENDLAGAVGAADEQNAYLLTAYVKFLYNYAPMGCWGSKAKVESWLDNNDKGAN